MATVRDRHIGIIVLKTKDDVQAATEYAAHMTFPVQIIPVEGYQGGQALAIIILQRSHARRLQLIIDERAYEIWFSREVMPRPIPEITEARALSGWKASWKKEARRATNALADDY